MIWFILVFTLLAALVYGVVCVPCWFVMRFVRSRRLAWLIDMTLLMPVTLILVKVAFDVSGAYLGGPHLTDLLVASPLALVILALQRVPMHAARKESNECPCGYDLTGNESGVCPECGRKMDKPLE